MVYIYDLWRGIIPVGRINRKTFYSWHGKSFLERTKEYEKQRLYKLDEGTEIYFSDEEY